MLSYHYASTCSSFVEELKTALSEEEKDELLTFLKNWKDDERNAWNQKYSDEVFQYVQATPHQRSVKKKWNQSQTHRSLLIYNAYYLMVGAYYYLDSLSEIRPNLGYRQQAAECADIYSRLLDKKLPSFFDE